MKLNRTSEDHPLRARSQLLGEKLVLVQRQVEVSRSMVADDQTDGVSKRRSVLSEDRCIEYKQEI